MLGDAAFLRWATPVAWPPTHPYHHSPLATHSARLRHHSPLATRSARLRHHSPPPTHPPDLHHHSSQPPSASTPTPCPSNAGCAAIQRDDMIDGSIPSGR